EFRAAGCVAEIARTPKRGSGLVGKFALQKDGRATERKLQRQFARGRRFVCRQLRKKLEPLADVACSFGRSTSAQRERGSPLVVVDGFRADFGVLEMLSNDLGLGSGDMLEIFFERGGNLGMDNAPLVAYQRRVGRVLHQRMLEDECRLR